MYIDGAAFTRLLDSRIQSLRLIEQTQFQAGYLKALQDVKQTMAEYQVSIPTPRARNTDPDTSHKAAKNVRSGKLYSAILKALEDGTPRTRDEIVKYAHATIPASKYYADGSWHPSLSALAAAGIIKDTGRRRLSAHNREQIVWALA